MLIMKRFSTADLIMSSASKPATRNRRRSRQPAAIASAKSVSELALGIEGWFDPVPDDGDIFAALESFVAHATERGANDPLASDCLDGLQHQLELIRYRSDRGYQDAVRSIEEFQRAIAALVTAGRIGGPELAMLGSALHRAGIPASAEFTAAALEQSAAGFVA
jgi:hypothetical protein